MPRNAEVIRQWRILRDIESSRLGATINDLAGALGVSTRTIRRDLDALQEAGFPLYDTSVDGHARWKLEARPFKVLAETGLTLAELSALYLSRTLIECLAGSPFSSDLKGGFDKLVGELTPRMRVFLDRLPGVLTAKDEPKKRREASDQHRIVRALVDATLTHRRAKMTYYSFSSRRVKEYLIEPYRLAYGQGGLYLFAFVPEYVQMRTFAVERIRKLHVLEEHFEAIQTLPSEAFEHSLGIHTGRPERVEIEFSAGVAPYIKERDWHKSQKIRNQSDGSVVLSLRVCTDWALQSWILSFGPFARVIKPTELAQKILEEIEEAREQYAPRMSFEAPLALYDTVWQRALPFADPARGSFTGSPSR